MESTQSGTLNLRDLSQRRLEHVPLVLMYHNVGQVACDPYKICVTPDRFSEQMAWLAEHGLRGVSMDTLVAEMQAGNARGLVGITFDDGYAGVLEYAVPELVRHGFTATMFIVSGLLGGTNEWDGEPVWPLMSGQEVLEVAAAGMEIGSHGVTHVHLAGLDSATLAREVNESRSTLSELLGRSVCGFAYPYGIMDAASRRAVQDAGYDYACSVATPRADRGMMALPRITVSQRDGSARMAAKKIFFNEYMAANGAWITLCSTPLAQAAKRSLSAIARGRGHGD